MRSVLEFLQKTDELVADESISKAPYASSTVVRLKSYKERLKTLFMEHPEETMDIQNLLAQTNTLAMQLEFHLSRIDADYMDKYRKRQEAEEVFKSLQAILHDVTRKEDETGKNPLDDDRLIQFSQLLNFAQLYYTKSQFYCWDIEQADVYKLEEARAFMEEYNNGNIINSNRS